MFQTTTSQVTGNLDYAMCSVSNLIRISLHPALLITGVGSSGLMIPFHLQH
jgi:hypothetical protein